ncbi:unnamed protein product [Boreogadus saida]
MIHYTQPFSLIIPPRYFIKPRLKEIGISDEDTPVLSYPSSHVSSSKEQRTDQREPEERPPGGVQLLREEGGGREFSPSGRREGVQPLGEEGGGREFRREFSPSGKQQRGLLRLCLLQTSVAGGQRGFIK